MHVIAALFARETQGGAINGGEDMTAVTAFYARETQDFASLQGWRHHCFSVKQAISSCV